MSNIFTTTPSWDQIKKTLGIEGLAFWRLTRNDAGELMVNLSKEFLTLLGSNEQPGSIFLMDFFNKYCPAKSKELYVLAENALSGSPAEFSLAHHLVSAHGQRLSLCSFGRTTLEGDNEKQPTIYGFSKKMDTAAKEADERTHIMLDAMPMACSFWDEQHHIVDCNQVAPVLFSMPDKQTYLNNFAKLSPEFQPNGRPSMEDRKSTRLNSSH